MDGSRSTPGKPIADPLGSGFDDLAGTGWAPTRAELAPVRLVLAMGARGLSLGPWRGMEICGIVDWLFFLSPPPPPPPLRRLAWLPRLVIPPHVMEIVGRFFVR